MSLDIDYFLKELSFEASQILSNIYNYGPLKFDSTLNFTYQTQNIAYNLPPIEKMFILETLWGSFLSFSNICFDDFVFLLFAILLETPICFLSVNLCLLTSTM